MTSMWDLIEQKTWDEDGDIPFEDTNLSAIGSDEDKTLRKEAASNEEAWKAIPENTGGVWIWRIEEFKVVPWPSEKYGKFHENDSYIVLDVEEVITEEKTLAYTRKIFYWIGKTSSADEKGTAAYKTVELDDFFDGECDQSREVQGRESGDFLDIFVKQAGGLVYLSGGVESGFNPDIPDVYAKKLLRIHKKKGVNVWTAGEVPCATSSLNHAEVFIVDGGVKLWVWAGDASPPFARSKGGMLAHKLSFDRPGDEEILYDADDEMWEALGGEGEIKETADCEDDEDQPDLGHGIMYKLAVSEDFQLQVEEIAREEFDKSMLDTSAIMMVWTRTEIFVWVGKETTKVERRHPIRYGLQYIKTNDLPKSTSISVIKEGSCNKNQDWASLFGGPKRKSGASGGMCGSAAKFVR